MQDLLSPELKLVDLDIISSCHLEWLSLNSGQRITIIRHINASTQILGQFVLLPELGSPGWRSTLARRLAWTGWRSGTEEFAVGTG